MEHEEAKKPKEYEIIVDNKPFKWPEPKITGVQIKGLVHANAEYGVWLVVRGPTEDEEIADNQAVDLTKPGTEKFITGPKKSTEGAPSFLPARDRVYLAEKGIVYEEVTDGGQRGAILRQYPLPAGLFDTEKADLLILIPTGYSDVPPDMFYTLPWVKLTTANALPRCADQPHPFAGQTWQRWSRHNNEWRPGVDGIWSMLKRVDHALEIAAA
jgi:Prokaryotic E2 family E/Multiubiquitin